MNFMLFIAQQLREYMAKLGVRTVDEMVGRTDLLKKKDFLTGQAAKVDLSLILQGMNEGERKNCVFDPNCAYHFQLEQTKDEAELLKNKEILESVVQGKKSSYQVKLTNTDRTFGTAGGGGDTASSFRIAGGYHYHTLSGSGRTKLRRISAQRDYLVFVRRQQRLFRKRPLRRKTGGLCAAGSKLCAGRKCHYRQCRSLRGHRRRSLYRRHGRRTLLCEKFRRNSGCGRRG